MLGRSRHDQKPKEELSSDVGKLFFDKFSDRVQSVEQCVKTVMSELDELRTAGQKSQLSDLVLLERLQRAEGILAESLEWIKKVATAVEASKQQHIAVPAVESSVKRATGPATVEPPAVRSIVLPGGEVGSLSSMTTPTELQVLALLSGQGPKSAPEIGRVVGRSREHSARLMKKLFQEGYVKRDQSRIPFRYSLVDRVKASFEKPEVKIEKSPEETVPVQA